MSEGTGTDWITDQHPVFHTMSFAVPKKHAVPLEGGPREAAVLSMLARYKEVFGMRDPVVEWKHFRTNLDDQGFSHLRFYQQSRGVRVYGGDWIASVNARGELASMSGVYVPGVDAVDLSPTQTREQAADAARGDVKREWRGAANIGAEASPDPLIYAAEGVPPALAFAVRTDTVVDGFRHTDDSFVDAHTGAVLGRFDATHSQGATPYASGRSSKSYPPYNVQATDIRFPVSASNPPILDGRTRSGVRIQTLSHTSSDPITGSSLTNWTDTTRPSGAAIDAQANLARVVDAYEDLYKRKSFGDGKDVLAYINANDKGPINASMETDPFSGLFGWCNASFYFGDGDPARGYFPLSAAVDIVAHEFTHAIALCAWGGSIVPTPKAVDEAMSDILAMFITSKIEGGHPTALGRSTNVRHQPLRDLANPPCDRMDALSDTSLCPTYKFGWLDRPEPHSAGGIITYAWYLMTFGGTHKSTGQRVPCGLGWERSSRLWYQVQANEMPSSPDYKAAANATLSAGRKQNAPLQPIACAWVAAQVLKADDVKKQWNVDCPGASDAGVDSSPDGSSGIPDGGLYDPNAGPLVVCPAGPLIP
ncbi:M4 family metallopeptidase [Pendulispora albinea]|uniref:M4 family metallopeptidase n=1 Tax=Pendulispora albinea TaxID=2741071 RepID=A0ABZ2MB70_9BACT